MCAALISVGPLVLSAMLKEHNRQIDSKMVGHRCHVMLTLSLIHFLQIVVHVKRIGSLSWCEVTKFNKKYFDQKYLPPFCDLQFKMSRIETADVQMKVL